SKRSVAVAERGDHFGILLGQVFDQQVSFAIVVEIADAEHPSNELCREGRGEGAIALAVADDNVRGTVDPWLAGGEIDNAVAVEVAGPHVEVQRGVPPNGH